LRSTDGSDGVVIVRIPRTKAARGRYNNWEVGFQLRPETTNLIAAPVLTRLGTAVLSFIADFVPEIDQSVLPIGEASLA
jgi:hypothetical protein